MENNAESSSSGFGVSQEILRVLPSDPFEQINVAKNIAAMAMSSRISALEFENSQLRRKFAEKDQFAADLQQRFSRLENAKRLRLKSTSRASVKLPPPPDIIIIDDDDDDEDVVEVSTSDESETEDMWGFDERFAELEMKIGYNFKNKKLIGEALQCLSRLEFLGDAVLQCIMTQHFCIAYPQLGSGPLTQVRSANVCNAKFAKASIKHGLYHFIIFRNIGQQENVANAVKELEEYEKKESHDASVTIKLPKVLANFLECIAGAVFVDSGESLPQVWKVIRPFLEPLEYPLEIKEASSKQMQDVAIRRMQRLREKRIRVTHKWDLKEAKKLMQLCQKRKWTCPQYRCIRHEGSKNRKRYLYSVQIPRQTDAICGKLMIGREAAKNEAAAALYDFLTTNMEHVFK